MSTTYSYSAVIDYAISIEQEGIRLYTDAAAELDNEPARNILLHLAEEEKKHEKYFRKLKSGISENDERKIEFNEEILDYIKALSSREIFPEDDKPFKERFQTLEDVIQFGLQTEKDSILFYVELSHLDCDAGTKQVLESIIKEEKRHMVKLTEIRKLIETRDVYY